jgi:hypothetical protein
MAMAQSQITLVVFAKCPEPQKLQENVLTRLMLLVTLLPLLAKDSLSVPLAS